MSDTLKNNIVKSFEWIAARYSDKTALIFGDEKITYFDLNVKANILAARLMNIDVKGGDRVAVYLEASVESIVSFLAILKIGAVYSPLDIQSPKQRLLDQLLDLNPKVAIVQSCKQLNNFPESLTLIDVGKLDAGKYSSKNPNITIKDSDPAYVIFTSGTSGKPKGVIISHLNIFRLFTSTNAYFKFNHHDVIPLLHATTFDFSIWEVGSALLFGGALVILPMDTIRSSQAICEELIKYQFSVICQTPSAFSALISVLNRRKNECYASLRQVIFGGEKLLPSVVASWYQLFPNHAAMLVNMYGITEITVHATYYLIGKDYGEQTKSIIGTMLPDLGFCVLNEQGEECSPGEIGELCIYGAGVSSDAYLNRKKLSKEKFRMHNDKRIYTSGDLVRLLPDKNIEYIGRKDTQVKIRGYRVELGDIESHINQVSEVEQAIVIKRDTVDDDILVVYVVLKEQYRATDINSIKTNLLGMLNNTVPTYMIPRDFYLVDSLPLTAHKKIDRNKLVIRDKLQSELTHDESDNLDNTIEQILGLMASCLNVSELSSDDNFFHRGGHSLLVMKLISKIYEQFNVEVKFSDIFTYPSARLLSQYLNSHYQVEQKNSKRILTAPQNPDNLYPVSSAQARIWFTDQLAETPGLNHIHYTIEVTGEFCLERFKLSIASIIKKHSILRTVFVEEDHLLKQKLLRDIDKTRLYSFYEVGDARHNIQKFLNEFYTKDFILESEPPWRIGILNVSENLTIISFCFHHLVMDGWSIMIFLKALSAAYNASFEENSHNAFAQYIDFSFTQDTWLSSDKMTNQLIFWRSVLSEGNTLLNLPYDHSRGENMCFEGAIQELALDSQVYQAIKHLSAEMDATPFIIFLAVYQLVLSVFCNQLEFNIGMPVANRSYDGAQSIIGPLINLIPMPTKIDKAQTVQSYLQGVRETSLLAFDNQDLPFEILAKELGITSSVEEHPIFQVLFSSMDISNNTPWLDGLDIKDINKFSGFSKFCLSLNVLSASSDKVSIHIEYQRELFNYNTIRVLGDHYISMLSAVAKSMGQRLGTFMASFGAIEYDSDANTNTLCKQEVKLKNLIDSIFVDSDDRLQALAVACEHTQLTYQELRTRSNIVTSFLMDKMIQPGDIVGLYLERNCDMIAIILGVIQSGACFLPLDIHWPKAHFQKIIADASPKCIIFSSKYDVASSDYFGENFLVQDVFDSCNSNQSTPLNLNSNRAAYVIYTSGSSGQPKGVVVSHRSLLGFLQSAKDALAIDDSKTFLASTSLCFDISLLEIFMPLITGGKIVISQYAYADTASNLISFIAKNNIDYMQATPSMWRIMLDLGWTGSQTMTLLCGGEILDENLAMRLKHQCQHLWHMYGPTEATIWSMYQYVTDSVCLGKPLPQYQVYILDDEMSPCKVGELGELYIGGVGVCAGYLNQPSLTNKFFVSNPSDTKSRDILYRTGDLAQRHVNGDIVFHGRRDLQIKFHGHRIELSEIERTLSTVNGVITSAVVYDQARDILVAFIQLDAEYQTQRKSYMKSVRLIMEEKLPRYMVPSEIRCLDHFPFLASNKVDRASLINELSKNINLSPCSQESLTPVEFEVIQLFRKVLSNDVIRLSDNFFSLGGHSLLAMRLLSEYNSFYAIKVSLNDFFRNPTPQYLVDCIPLEDHTEDQSDCFSNYTVPLETKLALTPAQRRIWFNEQLLPASSLFFIPVVWEVIGTLDIQALERAVSEMLKKYTMLSATFGHDKNGEPYQVVTSVKPFSLLHRYQSDQIFNMNDVLIDMIYSHKFDLLNGPLCHFQMLGGLNKKSYFVMFFHHIIVDGWSIDVLIRDLSQFYNKHVVDSENHGVYPDGAVDVAAIFLENIDIKSLNRQKSYWEQQLANYEDIVALPYRLPMKVRAMLKSSIYSCQIDANTKERVNELSSRLKISTFTLLFSIFQILLHRYSGKEDIIINIPSSGRNFTDSKHIISPMLNILPIRSRTLDTETIEQFLSETQRLLLEAYDNQNLSFDEIMNVFSGENNSKSSSWGNQCMVVYQPAKRAILELNGCQTSEVIVQPQYAKYDLTLWIREHEESIQFDFEFGEGVFDAGFVENFAQCYLYILSSALQNKSLPIAELDVLSNWEIQHKFIEWNNTKVALSNHTVMTSINANIISRGDSIALVYGSTQLSYRELGARVSAFCHELSVNNVGKGDVIGVYLERSVELVVTFLSILAIGGVYFPIEPGISKQRLSGLLSDADPTVVITSEELQAIFSELPYVAILARCDAESTTTFESNLSGSDGAYLLYTSGTTGNPKGVYVSHLALVNRLLWMQDSFELKVNEKVLHKTSINFDVSLWELCWPLMIGAQLHLAPHNAHRNPRQLMNVIKNSSINVMHFVPSMLRLFLEHEPAEYCKSLRLVIASGEALSKTLIRKFYQSIPADLHNLYGPTEACIDVTHWPCMRNTDDVYIGRPIWNTQILILNECRLPVPIGVVGEIYIGGIGLADGYYKNQSLTEAHFVDINIKGLWCHRFYKSGDLGRYSTNGLIEYCGRVDSEVKHHGQRISLETIERELENNAKVKAAKVLQLNKNDIDYLIAFVIASKDEPEAILKHSIRKNLLKLFSASAIPSDFILLDKFPVNSVGKCDTNSLAEIFMNNEILSENTIRQKSQGDALIDNFIVSITKIWSEYLRHANFKVDDNFFDIGGNSIILVKIQCHLERAFDVRIDITDLFEHTTVEAIADYIHGKLSNFRKDFNKKNHGAEPRSANKCSDQVDQSDSNAVAIIGMDCRLPGAASIDQLWENLSQGKESIQFFTDRELLESGVSLETIQSNKYVKAKGVIDNIEAFDYKFFNISEKDAQILDPQQRIFLEMCWCVLDDAGYANENSNTKIGVFASANSTPLYLIKNILPNEDIVNQLGLQQITLNNQCDSLASRVSYKLNLSGPAMTIQTACSSSLVAICTAVDYLRARKIDMALAGGISITLPGISGYLSEYGMLTSPDGHCRAFDKAAQGMVPSDGGAVVGLKRLSDAIKDNDLIYAVIDGVAVNNDGSNKVGFTAPSVSGQISVIESACADAGISASELSYIEGHGTGTHLGDKVEIAALNQIFSGFEKTLCFLGSIKSNIGHTNVASGVAGLIKTALMLHNKKLVPSLHVTEPLLKNSEASDCIIVSTQTKDWDVEGKRFAGVSSFGMGGTNAHAILSDFDSDMSAMNCVNDTRDSLHYITLSAHSGTSLYNAEKELLNWLEKTPCCPIAFLAYSTQIKRNNFPYRSTFIVESIDSLKSELGFRRDTKDYFSYDLFTTKKSNTVNLIKGLDVDFDKLRSLGLTVLWADPDSYKKIRLPKYNFDSYRSWIDPVDSEIFSAVEKNTNKNIDGWLSTETWSECVLVSYSETKTCQNNVLIFTDNRRYFDNKNFTVCGGDNIIFVTSGSCFTVSECNSITINPMHEQDYAELADYLISIKYVPSKVIHAWSLGNSFGIEDFDESQFNRCQFIGFYSVIYLVRNLFNKIKKNNSSLLILTNSIFLVDEQDRCNLGYASLRSVGQVIAEEHIGLKVKHIDVSDRESDFSHFFASDIFHNEMNTFGKENIVAYRNGIRFIPQYQKLDLPRVDAQKNCWIRGNTYIIIGGLGHMGMAIINQITKMVTSCNIVLLSRNALVASRQYSSKFDLLKRKGHKLMLLDVDVSDYSQIILAFEKITQSYGRIHGIIHAAGSPGSDVSQYCGRIKVSDAAIHFSTKVIGLWNLYKAVCEYSVDFVCVMSSLASRLGGHGLVAYAAANYTADMIVDEINRSRFSAKFVAIDWDNWCFTHDSEGAVSVSHGLSALERLLSSAISGSLQVSIQPLNNRVNDIQERIQNSLASIGTAEANNGNVPDNNTSVREVVSTIWDECLGLNGSQDDYNFFELGGDSFTAINIANRISERLNISFMPYDILEFPSFNLHVDSIEKLMETKDNLQENTYHQTNNEVSNNLILPLSFAQSRLWITEQRYPNTPLNNMPYTFWIKGNLNIQALEKAFQLLVNRYDTLRMSIEEIDAQPFQVIHPSVTFRLRVIEAYDCHDETRYLRRQLDKELETAFDLTTPPLLRATIYMLPDNKCALVLFVHHIATDGYSMEIFFKELASCYESLESSVSPDSCFSYSVSPHADFTKWQHSHEYDDSKHLKFWREYLSDIPVITNLPFDRIPTADLRYQGGCVILECGNEVLSSLRSLAKQSDTTLYVYIFSIYKLFLYHYTSQSTVVVGTPTSQRHFPNSENIFGFLVNTLPIKFSFDENISFSQYVSRYRKQVIECFKHQDVYFDQIVKTLNLQGVVEHHPIFQTVFMMNDSNPLSLNLKGTVCTPLNDEAITKQRMARSDLYFIAEIDNDRLSLKFEYAQGLFEKHTIETMATSVNNFIEQIVSEPDMKIFSYQLLSDAEIKTLSVTHIDSTAKSKSWLTLFRDTARKFGTTTAIKLYEKELSYSELDQQSNQLSILLKQSGVQQGDLIALMMRNTIDYYVALLSVQKAGAAFVFLDAEHPEQRVNNILAQICPKFIIVDEDYEVISNQQEIPLLNIDVLKQKSALISLDERIDESQADLTAYLIFTSGSTGEPKVIPIRQYSLANLATEQSEQFKLKKLTSLLQFSQRGFDSSVAEWSSSWVSGATLCLMPDNKKGIYDEIIEAINYYAITVVCLPPSLLSWLTYKDVPTLKTLISAGESCSKTIITEFADKLNFFNAYGPSETAVCATMKLCDLTTKPNDIGVPINNVFIYILDRNKHLLPRGLVGEIYIGGVGLSPGYLNDDQLNREKFIINPLSDSMHDNLYATGDLGSIQEDGTIRYHGRVDQQIKIRGYRVELGEIESQLMQCSSIKNCYLKSVQVELVTKIMAYVELVDDDASFEEGQVKKFLSQSLPHYMIPHKIIALDNLPLLANGKINTRALDVLMFDKSDSSIDDQPKDDSLESKLSEIWCDCLGVSTIKNSDNFFELGGDSIIAIQVVSKAKKIGLPLSVKQIFSSHNFSDLITEMKTATRDHEKSKNTSPPNGVMTLSAIQMWFFELNMIDFSHWNQSILMRVSRNLNYTQIRACLNLIFLNHEVFSQRFSRENEKWAVVVKNNDSHSHGIDVRYVDIRHHNREDHSDEINRVIKSSQSNLNIMKGPLADAVIIDAQEQLLFLSIHHLIIDAVSWRVILDELETLLLQSQAGKKLALHVEAVSYSQWASLNHSNAKTGKYDNEILFWNNQLAHALGITLLDCEHREINNIERHSTLISERLSAVLSKKLSIEIPKQQGVRLQESLLCGLALALNELTGNNNVLVNLESHGRDVDNIDVANTLGWFTAIYPVCVSVDPKKMLIDNLMSLHDFMSSVPNDGRNYLSLKFLNKIKLPASAIQPEVCLNYLGSWVQKSDSLLTILDRKKSYNISLNNVRPHLVDINVAMVDGEIIVDLQYSSNCLNSKFMSRLMNQFLGYLKAIANTCHSTNTMSTTILNEVTTKSFLQYDSIESMLPCTPMQLSLLYQAALLGETSSSENVYFIQSVWDVEGAVNYEKIESAWNYLAKSYSILRTCFNLDVSGQPMQMVLASVEIPFVFIDLFELGEQNSGAHLSQVLEEDKKKGFNIEKAPLLRVTLIRYGLDDYKMLVTNHHLILDGWSGAVLMDKFLKVYAQLSLGQAPNSISDTYSRYTNWLDSVDERKSLDFWHSYFQGYSEHKLLSDAVPQTAYDDSGHYETELMLIDAMLMESLISISKLCKCSLNAVFQAAWATLLGKYLRKTDVVFGITVSGRSIDADGVDEAVGLLINTLPVRVNLDGDWSIRQLIEDVHNICFSIADYGHLPLSKILATSELTEHTDLIDHLFVFENYPVPVSEPADHGFMLTANKTFENSSYPLTIIIAQSNEMTVKFGYKTDFYDRCTIRVMAQNYLSVLRYFVANLKGSLSRVCLLSPAEQAHYLEAPQPYIYSDKPALTLSRLFEIVVEANPDTIAMQNREELMTYGQLNLLANQLSNYIDVISPNEEIIAIAVSDKFWSVVSMLAILKSGRCYFPLDLNSPVTYLQKILSYTGKPPVLVDDSTVNLLASDANRCINVHSSQIADQCAKNPSKSYNVNDNAYLMYTSGTTALAKGVLVNHKGVIRLVCEPDYINIGRHDCVAQAANFAFDAATFEIWGALLNNARLVFAHKDSLLNSEALKVFLMRRNISILWLTSSLFNALISVDDSLFAQLNYLIVGGEQLQVRYVNKLLSNKNYCPRYFLNGYGPTESTTFASVYSLNRSPYSTRIPIGRAIKSTALYILDRYLNPLPPGVVGEIYIAGDGLANGYFNQPELTAEKFITVNFSTGKVYKTGDLGFYYQNGVIKYVGREDDQLKRRGYLMSAAMVESLINDLSYVKDVKVVTDAGENDCTIRAYIVLSSAISGVEALVRESITANLPSYLQPSTIDFIDSIPLNVNGKLDVLKLAVGVNGTDDSHLGTVHSSIENKLLEIFELLLQHDQILVTDDFFQIGGHSLLIIQLIYEINRVFNIVLNMSDVLKNRSIRAIAKLIEGKRKYVTEYAVSCLNKLSRGTSDSTIVFFPPGDGLSICYTNILKYLPGYNIYAFNDPAYGVSSQCFLTLEQMSQFYVDALLDRNFSAPVHLIGWSFGGALAFEVAKRLAALGCQNGAVIMLDSYNLSSGGFDVESIISENMSLVDAAFSGSHEGNSAEKIKEIVRKNIVLLANYKPEYYDFNVNLIKSEYSRNDAVSELQDYGWANFCNMTIDTVDIFHNKFMDKECVGSVAIKIKEIIGSLLVVESC